jgi:UDP-N-acetylglucosamine 2-epimerase
MKASELLHDRLLLETMAKKTNPYGDGKAAKRIVAVLLERANSN